MTPTPMPPLTLVPTPGPTPYLGPEDAVIAEDGTVYSALRNDGLLLRVRPGGEAEVIAELGGRGLGVELLPGGRVLVCNADLGLQAVDPETGAVESLLSEVGGEPFVLCNNAAVGRDGTIYVSESTRRHDLGRYRRDIVEDNRSGRLIRWRPGSAPDVLLEGLSFANGVALDPEERFVLVAETARCRVHKVDLATGAASVFAEVPGYPDNLSVGGTPHQGGPLFWLALPAPPSDVLTRLHAGSALVRGIAARLPDALAPKAERACLVAAYDQEGRLVHLLEGDAERYHHVTGVREREGRVWLGSIEERALAWFDLPGRPAATRGDAC